MSHTPTPWHVAHYGEMPDGTAKFLAIKHGSRTIATIDHWDGPLTNSPPQPDDYANARLVAAAPELLEVATTALTALRMEANGPLKQYESAYGPLRKSLEDAIAKARGDQS